MGNSMSEKIIRAKIEHDQTLLLPEEAISILGKDCEIYLNLDGEKGTMVLSTEDPDVLHNNAILEQLTALNEEMGISDVVVPESFLNKRGKGNSGVDKE